MVPQVLEKIQEMSEKGKKKTKLEGEALELSGKTKMILKPEQD